MKLNPTSINQYLTKKTLVHKYDLHEIVNRLGRNNREDAKEAAEIWLTILEERKQALIDERKREQSYSPLYRICVPFKVDCYNALCRFIEFKYSEFIYTPDRIPKNPQFTEEQGYWYNSIIKKTGYFSKSCGHILNNQDPREVVLPMIEEFKQFILNHHKVLKKYRKFEFKDYSHLAYNGVTDDF